GAEASGGTAFLVGKQARAATEEAADHVRSVTATAVHDRLLSLAADGSVGGAPVGPDARDVVLAASYLVPDARSGEFRQVAEELGAAHRDRGFALRLTGPWAPYSFTELSADES